jgi:LacI family transcriptional regulator, galactose operon repressor
MRPTMRDVARRAGVSLKTVSRVVNGEDGVRADTTEKVNAAISALGFRRNDIARALRGGERTRSLGLVIKDVANPFYSQIARGVEEIARTHDLLVISGCSDEDPARERHLIRSLCERRVDGLLVVPSGNDHRYLIPEINMGTPAAFIDRPPEEALEEDVVLDVVLLDNAGGARTAVTHLVEYGHRRIACLSDLPGIFTARERLLGYEKTLREHGVPVDPSLVCAGQHDVAGAEAAMAGLLALDDPPTAVFTGNNRLTVGALRAIQAAGAGTALVGFDDLELADMLAMPVTVVAHHPAEMGRRAADLLCRRMAGEELPPQRVVLPTHLIVRGSGELPPP